MLKNINGKIYGYNEATEEWYDPATRETIPSPLLEKPLKRSSKQQDNTKQPGIMY